MNRAPASAKAKAVEPNETRMTAMWTQWMNVRSFANLRRWREFDAMIPKALLAEVRAAGSWNRYANAPRIDVIVLQRLCAAGRASPPPALARLFPTKSPPLPKELVWLILKFWRTDRDP